MKKSLHRLPDKVAKFTTPPRLYDDLHALLDVDDDVFARYVS